MTETTRPSAGAITAPGRPGGTRSGSRKKNRQNSANSRPSQASQGPSTRPSSTATRPPRMNGRPAGWGGASTWPMSSTSGMRGAGLWMLHLEGARLGASREHVPCRSMRRSSWVLYRRFRGPAVALRAGKAPAFLFRWRQSRGAGPARPRTIRRTGGWSCRPPSAVFQVPPARRTERCGLGASLCSHWLPQVGAARLAGLSSGRPSCVAGDPNPDRTADHRRGADHRDHAIPAGAGAVSGSAGRGRAGRTRRRHRRCQSGLAGKDTNCEPYAARGDQCPQHAGACPCSPTGEAEAACQMRGEPKSQQGRHGSDVDRSDPQVRQPADLDHCKAPDGRDVHGDRQRHQSRRGSRANNAIEATAGTRASWAHIGGSITT